MGAWGIGLIDNDTAMDSISFLKDVDEPTLYKMTELLLHNDDEHNQMLGVAIVYASFYNIRKSDPSYITVERKLFDEIYFREQIRENNKWTIKRLRNDAIVATEQNLRKSVINNWNEDCRQKREDLLKTLDKELRETRWGYGI